jgi:hypothetical protein
LALELGCQLMLEVATLVHLCDGLADVCRGSEELHEIKHSLPATPTAGGVAGRVRGTEEETVARSHGRRVDDERRSL